MGEAGNQRGGLARMSKLESVYIIESLKPVDFYERQLDGYAANEILRVLGMRSEYRIAFTKSLIGRSIAEAAAGGFEVLHFSSHGNSGGIRLTDGTRLSWAEFAEIVRPASGPEKALVMATCGGGDKELTKALTSAGVVFGWVFGSTVEEVYFVDSCLAWSILYNRLFDHGFKREDLKVTLKAINAAIRGDFVYRRWTGKKYRHFPIKR
jgi:hypothetical protein